MPKKTVLLKLSGEVFRAPKSPVDLDAVKETAIEIDKIRKDVRLGVVFGGGNIFRGRTADESLKLDMGTTHFVGMTATLVNALALKVVFDALSIPSRIISSVDYSDVIGKPSRFHTNEFLDRGEVLIFAGGTGNPFVTTDTASVIRALEIRADCILKGTSVRGIYNADPRKHSQATQYKELSYDEYLRISGAHILDSAAVTLAKENNLPIYVFEWAKNTLKRAIRFRSGGTIIKK